MRRYASAHGLLESVYDPQHSRVTPNQLKALLTGSSSISRHPAEQVDSAPSVQTLAPMGTAQAFNGVPPSGMGPNLPLSLQIGDYKVWDYLVEVMSRGWIDAGTFRLSPAYSLYLALRFFQSHSKPYLVQFFTRIAHHMNQISQDCTSREELLFWLANASELSFLVERDPDLRTPRAGQLGTVVETVFRRLCTVLLGALRPACKPMLDINIPIEDGSSKWAEQMGVELAAECHLDRSRQAAALLAARKRRRSTWGHLLQIEQLAEQLRGVPDGLVQYLLSLQDKGLCHSVSVQESSLATWRASPLVNSTNVQQRPPVQTAPGPSPQLPLKSAVQRTPSQSTLTSLPTTHFGDSFGSMNDEVIRVVLKRGTGGIGLSIVAAQ
ncbi:hypothetical protein OSTOST_16234, partial [Ostertagia ostertagi]